MDIQLKPNEILVLRDVKHDMTSRGGFRWPEAGQVEAPDWRDDDECGGGLHGLPWGEGGYYSIGDDNGKWLVVRVCVDRGNYQHGTGAMTNKCKFRAGEVVFVGSREDAVAIVSRYAPSGAHINWSTQTAGNRSIQTAGYRSTQTAGYWSTQTAGDDSTQTAGDDCYFRAGVGSVQITRWYDSDSKRFNTAARVVTEAEANRWYHASRGVWTKLTDEEVAEIESRLSK